MTALKDTICKVICGDTSGTGFFVTSSILLTASHVVLDYTDDDTIPIQIYFDNQSGRRSAVPINNTWDSLPIVALKIDSPLETICVTAWNQDPVQDDIITAHGFLADKITYDSYKCTVTRKFNAPILQEDCNTYLLPIDSYNNYEGLSGAPLFFNGLLTGMVLRQTLEGEKAVRIEAITGNVFLGYIENYNINIDTRYYPHTQATTSGGADLCDRDSCHFSTDSVYFKDGKLYVEEDSFQLPPILQPPQDIKPKELPYINALCDAYADKLIQKTITPNMIDTLPGRYIKDFASQRKSYYAAEWLLHSIVGVLGDGEEKFKELEEDAYDGIESTYLQDYDNGYLRLHAVLEKITSTTLEASIISRIKNLLKNEHKKGICHMLVNDGKINSWVDIDE